MKDETLQRHLQTVRVKSQPGDFNPCTGKVLQVRDHLANILAGLFIGDDNHPVRFWIHRDHRIPDRAVGSVLSGRSAAGPRGDARPAASAVG